MFFSVVGYGFLQATLLAAKNFGSNGYLGVIAAFILALPVILAVRALSKRFPDHSMLEYLPQIFGRPLGKLLGFIYLLFLALLFIWVTLAISVHFNLYFLIRTPFIAIVFVILGTQLFLSYKGIETLARLAAFVFRPSLIFLIITQLTSFQNFDVDNVRPVLYFQPAQLPQGIIRMFYIYIPLVLLFQYHHYLTQKDKTVNTVVRAASLGGILIFVSVLAAIGTYGAKAVTILNWPITELGRQSDIPLMFQSVGLIVSPIIAIYAIIASALTYYTFSQGLVELSGKWHFKGFLLLFFPLFLVAVGALKSDIVMQYFFQFLNYAGFGVGFVFPLLVWFAAFLMRKGVKQ